MTPNDSRIKALDSDVIDQIAAGEVLERPAHLVKELIENSIDAGSTEIELHLGAGGRSLVLIDNGKGFHPEDLSLALQRHTTSKLKTADDLWSLSSYGFRGEALASISAVSHLNIRTHRKGEKCVELQSEFGIVKAFIDSSLDLGTRIEINNLYQNTPARLKFLKTDASEVMEIKKVLYAFGLCRPHLSLRFFYRDHLEFYWPGVSSASDDLNQRETQIIERNKNILGTQELYGFQKDFGDIQVQIYFAPPHETAKSNRKLWTFVQDRWVQEPMILAAIRDGFQNTLLPGEYPIGAIFIEVPKDFVDVNVHPTKSKVKFKEQSSVYRAVRQTLLEFVELSPWREEFLGLGQKLEKNQVTDSYSEYLHQVLNANAVRPKKNYSFKENSSNKNLSKNYSSDFSNESLEEQNSQPLNSPTVQTDFELGAFRSQKNLYNKSDSQWSGLENEKRTQQIGLDSVEQSQSEGIGNRDYHELNALNRKDIDQHRVFDLDENSEIQSSGKEEVHSKNTFWSNLVVIGQVGKTYLVTQNQTEVVYIDQHAAHERCLFEKLWQSFKNGKKLETQRHLLPISFKVDDESLMEILLKNSESLEKLGLVFEQSGPKQIEIVETPSLIKDAAIVKALEKMVEQYSLNSQSFIFEDIISDIFATMACHSAIRAGQLLTQLEMEELLNLMDEYSTTSYCPHGRPVFVRYSFLQIEKDFCRRV